MKHIVKMAALVFAALLCLSLVGCAKPVEHTEKVELFSEKTLLLDKDRDGVDWESDSPKTVSVDQKGRIKGLKPGDADVTALVKDKPVEIFHVTVEVVPVEKIEITPAELTLEMNESATLSYTLSPSDASDYKIEWKSSDDTVATIDEAGKLQALRPGTASISCTAPSGVSKTCEVTVTEIMAKEVALDTADVTLDIDGEQTVHCIVKPDSAASHPATWTSSDTSVATVDEHGVITAKSSGTCTILVQVDEKTAQMQVSVTKLNAKERAVAGTWKMTSAHMNGKTSYLTGIQLILREDKTAVLDFSSGSSIEIVEWGLYQKSSDSSTDFFTLKKSDGLLWLFFHDTGSTYKLVISTNDDYMTFTR